VTALARQAWRRLLMPLPVSVLIIGIVPGALIVFGAMSRILRPSTPTDRITLLNSLRGWHYRLSRRAVPPKPRAGTRERLRRPHAAVFGIGQARGIINGDMHVLPAGTPHPAAATATDSLPHVPDPPQLS
jgi:hypothetical protein